MLPIPAVYLENYGLVENTVNFCALSWLPMDWAKISFLVEYVLLKHIILKHCGKSG